VRLHQTVPTISDRGNITMFPKRVGLALRDEPKRRAQNQLTESETASIISDMACTISHDMRHSLSAIYANAEFLECPNMSAPAVKSHPSGRNVSIRVGKFPLAEADIDAMSLHSAIFNLLLNACQAATRSVDMPVVEVFLVEVEQRLYITIMDNGPGIPASVRETLFDPFVTMGKPNGTGLGLTMARRIAEEHGGSVVLEESNPKGTIFTLSLTKNRLLT
jgi:signal transduction histidine kinase